MTAEVGPERMRVWQLYMSGSALAFADGDISVFQVLAARPGRPHGLPLAREAGVSAAAAARPRANGVRSRGDRVHPQGR
jgi:cyclopropane-fatty-acyl-phospholipid synthase